MNQNHEFDFKPWKVGKIEGSSIEDLDKRRIELDKILQVIECEKEFILYVRARLEVKRNEMENINVQKTHT